MGKTWRSKPDDGFRAQKNKKKRNSPKRQDGSDRLHEMYPEYHEKARHRNFNDNRDR